MTRNELRDLVRQNIGRPLKNAVEDKEIDGYVLSALDWLAGEIPDFQTRTDSTGMGLVASQAEYPLPGDVLEIIFVEWNGNKLEPRSIWEWDRLGTDYRGATASNPTEFAIQGRNLVLYPPPSSTAITTAPNLVVRYIATPGLTPAGVVGLSDADQRVVAYRAAWEYLLTHPSEANAALAQGVGRLLADTLPQAQRRAADMAQDHAPRFIPLVRREDPSR